VVLLSFVAEVFGRRRIGILEAREKSWYTHLVSAQWASRLVTEVKQICQSTRLQNVKSSLDQLRSFGVQC